jgi:hypothetical protein
MTQYDNTDSGAVFQPRDNHKMILTGKLNNDGKDAQMVVTMSVLPDGRKIMDVYEKVGTLFPNEKKDKETAPDYTGPLGHRRVAAWKKSKDGNAYMSLNISDKIVKNDDGFGAAPAAPAQPLNDDIPF